MEAIVVIVGFLGAGKTTVLRNLISQYNEAGWNPFVILNDYENAMLDVQQLNEVMDSKSLKPLDGSCICCSGITELRESVNLVPERECGITLIEANGTSDAYALMGFLGVGIDERFLPPVQVSIVDVKNWQTRGENNELEANQIQVSSLILLSHLDGVDEERRATVVSEIKEINPLAEIITIDELDITQLPTLSPSQNKAQKMDHKKAHWASCSTDLPSIPDRESIEAICSAIPKSILRVKGCTKLGDEKGYTYFERTPDGKTFIRPFYGTPTTGCKLLTVGPGSDPILLDQIIADSLEEAKNRV